jgi:hypothetical protein
MAVSSIQCPHCETLVENPSGSTVCPACGELVIGTKSGLRNGYEALPEEAFERMRLDPSVVKLQRRFLLGVAAVIGLIVLATAVDHFRESQTAEPVAATRAPAAGSEETQAIQYVQPVLSTASVEERLGRLRGEAVTPTNSERKTEKLAAPVFEVGDETAALKQPAEGAPAVFEVSDLPGVAAPRP